MFVIGENIMKRPVFLTCVVRGF